MIRGTVSSFESIRFHGAHVVSMGGQERNASYQENLVFLEEL